MRRGFAALSLAIIIMAVFGVIGIGFYFLSNTQEVLSRSDLRGAQSFFTAEAGIGEAIAKYKYDNAGISLTDPEWYYGKDATSLSVAWSPYIANHELASVGSISMRVENVKIHEETDKVYFYAEGVIFEGSKEVSRFPVALCVKKSSGGITAELLGVGEVVIRKSDGSSLNILSEYGYRGGPALKKAFEIINADSSYDGSTVMLGPGVYAVPLSEEEISFRSKDKARYRFRSVYCGIVIKGRKVTLRAALGWGPHWVKIEGIVPLKAKVRPSMYRATILVSRNSSLSLENVWLSSPIDRNSLEGASWGWIRHLESTSLLVNGTNTSLSLRNCIIKNKNLVLYEGGVISGLLFLMPWSGNSELYMENCVLDGGNYLDYQSGWWPTTSIGIHVVKVTGLFSQFNASVKNSVIIDHSIGIWHIGFWGGGFKAENCLFYNNGIDVLGNATLVNPVREEPKFKSYYSSKTGKNEIIEWFRHWDSYVPDENSPLDEKNIGLTSSYWKETIPVPKGGEIVLLLKKGNSYSVEYFYDADSLFDEISSYYSANPDGSAIAIFGRSFWYLKRRHEFSGIKHFQMLSVWGAAFTPFFVFSPAVWEESSSDSGVISFSNSYEVKISGFYFGLSGGKEGDEEKAFISFKDSTSLDMTDCVFKRIYGGMGRLIYLAFDGCSDVHIYNNVFDHEYRKVVADPAGKPSFSESFYLNGVGISVANSNVDAKCNLFWGESVSWDYNYSLEPSQEENFYKDGDGRVIKSIFNPLSYRLILSDSNPFIESGPDGGDIGLRTLLYPYIRAFEGSVGKSMRLENEMEFISETDLSDLLNTMKTGESLVLGQGGYSFENLLSLSKDGEGLLGMWGPYYTQVKSSGIISISGRGSILYGIGFNIASDLSGNAVLTVSGNSFVFKDLFVRLGDEDFIYGYGVKVDASNGLLKNVYINGGFLNAGRWEPECDYGIYISSGDITLDHVNSVKHREIGIKWSGEIYGCNSYSNDKDYQPESGEPTNISVHPENEDDSKYNWVCFPIDSLCCWWNNNADARTGSYRGVDWANLPIVPK